MGIGAAITGIGTAIKYIFYLIIFIALLGELISWINPFDITGATANQKEIDALYVQFSRYINSSLPLISKCDYYEQDFPKIKGKILVCDYKSKKVSDIQTKISPELRIKSSNMASPADSWITLMFVNKFDTVAGRYEDYSPAIRECARVYVINLTTNSAIGYHTLWGGDPPASKISGGSGRGSEVTSEVVDWINSLSSG